MYSHFSCRKNTLDYKYENFYGQAISESTYILAPRPTGKLFIAIEWFQEEMKKSQEKETITAIFIIRKLM